MEQEKNHVDVCRNKPEIFFIVESAYKAFDQNGNELNLVFPTNPKDLPEFMNGLKDKGITSISIE